MARIFDKYYGVLRKLKFNYVLANVFNQKSLKHNQSQYEKLGLKKSVLLPVSSEDFKHLPDERPWIDVDFDREVYESKLNALPIQDSYKQALKDFPDNGFVVLKGFLTEEEVELVNQEIDRLIDDKVVDFNFTGRKVMFAFEHSEHIAKMITKVELLKTLSFLVGRKVHPFQTINFIEPSEQNPHSDSIHMTTYPLGFMNAAWFALEDISMDAGPIEYYPGSHKLPYILNPTFDHGGNKFRIGENAYGEYEKTIQNLIAEHQLKPSYFDAKKGDVLIWHGNLIHGGSKRKNPKLTRKSMVCHYFAEDVVCYHELTQRPAYIKSYLG